MMTYKAGPNTYDLQPDWGRVPPGYRFGPVSGIGIDRRDNVYVFNLLTHDVMVFNRGGELIRTWPHRYENAHAIHIDADDNVFIVDRELHAVRKYSQDGQEVMTLGTPGQPSDTGYSLEIGRATGWVEPVPRAAGPFNVPNGIDLSPDGDIFISDGYANCRVHRFDRDGALVRSWGSPGKTGPGQFHMVHGIALDGRGRVLVCDRQNDRVQVFTVDGEFLDVWNGLGKPSGVAVQADGLAIVAELPGRLTHLDRDGSVVARWDGKESGAFVTAHAVAVDSRGDIYVGDVGEGGRIKKFVRS